MHVTKEKIVTLIVPKKVLYAGRKSARYILTNLNPNPARYDLQLWYKEALIQGIAVAFSRQEIAPNFPLVRPFHGIVINRAI